MLLNNNGSVIAAIKRFFSKETLRGMSVRAYTLVGMCTVLVAVSAFSAVWAATKEITIIDDIDNPVVMKMYAGTVEKALVRANIKLGEYDEVEPPLTAKLSDGLTVEVSRAIPVSVTIGGEEKEVYTIARTVEGILGKLGINVADDDVITPARGETVAAYDSIVYVRGSYEIAFLEEDVPFATTERANTNLAYGQTQVVREGEKGRRKVEVKICYLDGEEVSREELSSETLTESVAKIVEKGTRTGSLVWGGGGTLASRGVELRYSKMLECSATAYTAGEAGVGSRTATGAAVRYGVVAVDPKVIPLGSRLYIEASNGAWVYGTAVAADTGGAIKGNKIDLYFDTLSECSRFGRRTAMVYVLE